MKGLKKAEREKKTSTGGSAVTGFSKEEVFQKMDAITNAIFDSCEPKITPNIAVQEIDGKLIIVVEIISGMQRPYYIKSQGIMDGTYIRVAGTTRHAERYRVQELIIEGTNRSYDQIESEQIVSENEIIAKFSRISSSYSYSRSNSCSYSTSFSSPL